MLFKETKMCTDTLEKHPRNDGPCSSGEEGQESKCFNHCPWRPECYQYLGCKCKCINGKWRLKVGSCDMGDFYMCVRKEDGYIVIRKCGPPGRGGGQVDGGGETRQIGMEKSGDKADENKGLFLQKKHQLPLHCSIYTPSQYSPQPRTTAPARWRARSGTTA